VGEIKLKGRIIGFGGYENYVMEDAFGEGSPFRALSCSDAALSFVVVNPYHIVEDYSFEIDEEVLKALFSGGDYMEDIAVLCVVRPDDQTLYVNLRSPIVVNIRSGVFVQTILQNETYGVSVPFVAKKAV
jgi:flagellar assembly factor FliW